MRGMSGKWKAIWHSSPDAEVGDGVFGPLIGFRQQNAILVFRIDVGAQLLEELMRLRQVLAVSAGAFEKIGHRVQAEAVDADVEPEIDYFEHCFTNIRIVEVQIGLMRIEAMPEVGFGHWIPSPVGGFEILEDDARVGIFVGRIAPDVKIAPTAAGR